jgi:putative oxidoreductase
METVLQILQYGIMPDTAAMNAVLFGARVMAGSFFALSGWHKLTDACRHATLVRTLREAGIPMIGINQWFVPAVELLGGLALISGILSPLAAMGLLIICCVASLTDGLARVYSWQPIDTADMVDDILYLPEVLYAAMLIMIIVYGPGAWTYVDLVDTISRSVVKGAL